MSIIRNIINWRGALADARAGIDSADSREIAAHGLRPRLDPVGNAEHAVIVKTLTDGARVEELREDLARTEDALVRHPPAAAILAAFAVAFLIEVLGSVLLMKAMGVHPNERLPFGIALAFMLIGITAAIARSGAARKASDGPLPLMARLRRWAWLLVLLVVYLCWVGAITVIRIQNAADEESSVIGAIAHGLVLLTTAVGPAWAAEWLVRQYVPAAELKKAARVLRRRIRKEERARGRAQRKANAVARAGAEWDGRAARQRARYETTHRLERVKVARAEADAAGENETPIITPNNN